MQLDMKQRFLFSLSKQYTLAQAELVVAMAKRDAEAIQRLVWRIRLIEKAQANYQKVIY